MTQLNAFVGHSFAPDDHEVVDSFLKYFNQLKAMEIGFTWESAEPAEPKDLADKVLNVIKDKNVFIGICTRKEAVIGAAHLSKSKSKRGVLTGSEDRFSWKTSDWVIQEIGLAIGRDMDLILLAFPEATAAFFEGSSIASDIVDIFVQHADSGPYLPQPQTLWSTGSNLRFRCLFTPSLCEALASVSPHHAEPELFDHLFLYAKRVPLLEWPDAFSNCMWIASSIAEARVSAFAANLGLRYKYANHG